MSMFDRLPQDQKALGALCSEAIKQLQDTLDEGTRRNTRDFLDKYEDLNQKLIAEKKRADRHEEALRTGARVDQYGEPSYPRAGYDRDTPHYVAFFKYLTCHQGGLEEAKNELKSLHDKSMQTKTLRTDAASAGGYLIPQVMDDTIKKNIIETSPVRAHARLRILTRQVDGHSSPPIGAARSIRG